MKQGLAKALVIAKIKERDKIKPVTWNGRKAGPWDRRPHKADGGPVTDPDILSQLNGGGGSPVTDPAILSQLNGDSKPKSFGDRLSNMWEKATPGGPLWMAKQAIEGMQGAVAGSKASTEEPAGTEEGAYLQNQARDAGPGAAMQAAQFMSPGAPGGGLFAVPKAMPAEAAATVAPEAIASQQLADQFGVKLSKGQATGDLDTIRYEDMAARGAYGKEAQDKASEFFQKQFQDTQDAGQSVGQQTARGAPVVDNPAEAAQTAQAEISERAARSRDLQTQTEQAATSEADAQRGMVADQGRALTDAIRGRALPVENPREAGEVVGQNVRDAATENRNEFRGLYDEFGRLPGEYRVDAVRGLGNRVQNDLSFRDNPIIIDDQLTPVSSRAIRDLDQMSAPRIQNRADPRAAPNPDEISAVSLKGVDQMRKKLVSYYQATRDAGPQGATDRRAMQGIMDAFDAQIERAHTEGLFSGDPRALQALQEARASYSRYRRQFTPQGAGDDVGTAIRRIVERNATPEETANMIVGTGKVGSTGTPVRLYDRLEQTLGPDSDSVSAIRQALWQKASQVRTAGAIDPIKSAANIDEFTGSSLAQRAFTNQERAAMRSHAQALRSLDQTIEQLPATQTAERVRSAYQDVFGGREIGGAPAAVFRRMVEGTATPEEITNGLFKVIGGGNPGNASRTIQAIERIVGTDSPTMSAIRQGVWQKLTQAAEGKDQPGAQKAMQAINEFLNGSGKTIAERLYSDSERTLMDQYQQVLKKTIIPKYARTNSDTAPAMLAAARKYAGMIGSALGVGTHGGVSGGLEGYAVGKMIDKVAEKFISARESKKVGNSLEGLIPDAPTLPQAQRDRGRQIPWSVVSTQLPKLQGPAPAGANNKQQ